MKTLSSLAVSVLASFAAFAGDLYVSTNDIHTVEGSDLGWGTYMTDDGECHDAYTNLQQAVNKAVAKDTVWVENGFVCDDSQGYQPADTTNPKSNARLRIRKTITVRSRSGHWSSGCEIVGSTKGVIIGGVQFSQNDLTAKLIGFTIRDCGLSAGSGACAVYYGSLSNCFVHGCTTSSYSTMERTDVRNCIISNCYASAYGGICYNGNYYDTEFVDIGKDLTTSSASQLRLQGGYVISNCTFRNCIGNPLISAHQAGASNPPKLIDCKIYGTRGANYAVVGTSAAVGNHITLMGCTFADNKAKCFATSYSAGKYYGCCVNAYNCIFTNNSATVIASSGVLSNCLIADNRCAGPTVTTNGDPDYSADLFNCTVYGNEQTGNYGAVEGNVRAVNTIIKGNVVKTGYNDSLATATNCCIEASATVGAGKDNITDEPDLINPAKGLYSPKESSPCRMTGSTTAYELPATDLAGRPRTTDGKVAIGAYEYDPTKYDLSVSAVLPTYLYASAEVTLNANAAGFGLAPVFYWDFDGDGKAEKVTMVPTLTHAFGVGEWQVTLSVSNLVQGTGGSIAYDPFTITRRPVRYVKLGNEENAAEPYDTEANAAADIQVALNYCADGDEVVILPGTYNTTNTIVVTKDLRVHGSTGNPEDVIIHAPRTTFNCLNIQGGAETIVHSLVLENGSVNSGHHGAGVLIGKEVNVNTAANPMWQVRDAVGTVSNVIVRNCYASVKTAGAMGIAAFGPQAFVTHCVSSNNSSWAGYANGARIGGLGLHVSSGARAENCLVAGNYTYENVSYNWNTPIYKEAGGINSHQGYFQMPVFVGDGSVIRFCTIVNNRASFCGGVNVAGTGRFEYCVIAGNTVRAAEVNDASPRYMVWAAFPAYNNSVKWDFDYNLSTKSTFDTIMTEEQTRVAEMYASQTSNAVDVAGVTLGVGTIVAPTGRLVRNLARGRYDLPAGSPAIDVVPADAASAMATKDLIGNRRLFCGAYDLGAFEKQQRGTMILVR